MARGCGVVAIGAGVWLRNKTKRDVFVENGSKTVVFSAGRKRYVVICALGKVSPDFGEWSLKPKATTMPRFPGYEIAGCGGKSTWNKIAIQN
jgi:hypothetical protein